MSGSVRSSRERKDKEREGAGKEGKRKEISHLVEKERNEPTSECVETSRPTSSHDLFKTGQYFLLSHRTECYEYSKQVHS